MHHVQTFLRGFSQITVIITFKTFGGASKSDFILTLLNINCRVIKAIILCSHVTLHSFSKGIASCRYFDIIKKKRVLVLLLAPPVQLQKLLLKDALFLPVLTLKLIMVASISVAATVLN